MRLSREVVMLAYIKELWSTRELLANLTMRDVKGKYRRTILGQLWSLINPLGTMLVYTIVFSFLFKAAPHPGDPSGLNIYPLWLMCGLLPWTFFTRVMSGSMTSIVSNANLIKKVYFPRMQLPFAVVGATGFTWLNEMGLIVVVVLICGGWVIPWIPLLLVLMALLALYASGIGMLLAILNTHFRDTEHFVAIGLRMMMYLTPVLYPLSLVESVSKGQPWILFVYELNPMEHFLTVFRNLLYDNRWPTAVDWIWCFSCALGVFVIGFIVFKHNERRLAVLL
jgi:ABC-type polysaccharide/polyol phosphate export permease